MKKLANSSLVVLVYGTVAALVTLSFMHFVMDKEQCPNYFTQAQVDQSNCIVGANIGLGFAYLLAIIVWLVSIVVALVIYSRSKKT